MTSRSREIRKRKYQRPEPVDVLAKDLPRAPCPRPDKQKYRSRKSAESAAEKQWRADQRILWAYPCGDHFHLSRRKQK